MLEGAAPYVFLSKTKRFNSTNKSGVHSSTLLSTQFLGVINMQLFTLEMREENLVVLHAVSVIYIPC